MGSDLSLTIYESPDEVATPDAVFFPVAAHDGVLRVPVGLPERVAGVDIPRSLDAAFCVRHGFKAKPGQSLIVAQGQDQPTLIAVGIGDPTLDDDEPWRLAAARVVAATKGERALLLLTLPSTVVERRLGEAVAVGSLLASYSYSLRSEESSTSLVELAVVAVATGGVSAQARDDLAAGVASGMAIASAVSVARDMVNRIPSELTPKRLANAMLRRLEKAPNVTASIWRDPRIEEERLGGLLGVARGSAQPPRLVIATYDPTASEDEEPSSGDETSTRFLAPDREAEEAVAPQTPMRHIVLVGKGVTFDSGGLSLKTATGMTTMKTDMTGAAIVLSALTVLADLGVTAKVTAIAPMTENMPGGAAMKPGDVLTARNGKTIEVLNTDAEGRLILADALSLAVEMEPDAIIDVATLTGAAVVALGSSMAALMANDDALAEEVLSAAADVGEPLWRLPLFADYNTQIESEIADIKNIGAPGQAGSITAGLFLQNFVGTVPWAHLDIAGPSRAEKTSGYLVKGGTAFGLRTLLAYLRALP